MTSPATPAITVAIPVYNRPELVRTALESALRQPQPDLEVLVVDNASDDGTWEVLQSYRDPRLRLVRNERNVGLFGNFNRCLSLARAPYVVTLCSDDALLDGFLAPARALLDRHPEVSLVSSRGVARFTATGRTQPLGAALPAGIYAPGDAVVATLWSLCTYYANPFNYPSGILVRAEVARAAGLMDESLAFQADLKLYFRMLETTGLAILDSPGCEVLIHPGQENDRIYRDTRLLEEWLDHFDRYADLVAARGMTEYFRAHVAGYLVGTSLKLRRAGNPRATAWLAAVERHGYPRLAGWWAAAHSWLCRAALRRGRRTSPVPFAS